MQRVIPAPQHRSQLLRLTLLVVAALVVVTATSEAQPRGRRSTAREPRPPAHLFDRVPGEPPAERVAQPEPSRLRESAPVPEEAGEGEEATPSSETVPPGRIPVPGGVLDVPTPQLVFLSPQPNQTWVEGDTVNVSWLTVGTVAKVRLYYWGEKCRLGGAPRGKFEGFVGGGMMGDAGEAKWKVPFLDSPSMTLKAGAYDSQGKLLSATTCKVKLLPKEFRDLPPTCIAISKRLQRLYYFVGGDAKRMHMISTAASGYSTPRMRPGSHGSRGSMGRVFSKSYAPFSSMYHVTMYYWLAITSSGSHGIHATSPPFYGRLGSPASHGCVRQHRADAKVLWGMVDVGTPVYVF